MALPPLLLSRGPGTKVTRVKRPRDLSGTDPPRPALAQALHEGVPSEKTRWIRASLLQTLRAGPPRGHRALRVVERNDDQASVVRVADRLVRPAGPASRPSRAPRLHCASASWFVCGARPRRGLASAPAPSSLLLLHRSGTLPAPFRLPRRGRREPQSVGPGAIVIAWVTTRFEGSQLLSKGKGCRPR